MIISILQMSVVEQVLSLEFLPLFSLWYYRKRNRGLEGKEIWIQMHTPALLNRVRLWLCYVLL